jgi:hypothetical protein
VPTGIAFPAAGQDKACSAEGGRRRVISAVDVICRGGVYGGADRRHHAAAGNAAVGHLPAMRWGGIVVYRQAEGGPLTHRPSAGCTCWSSLSGLRPVSAGNGEIVVAGGHTCVDSQFTVSPQGL